MQIIGEPYLIIDWDEIPIEKQHGETGYAWSRTYKTDNTRIVLAEYSVGYRAEYWCCKGQIMYLLEGDLNMEIKDGPVIKLKKGMSCCFSDNQSAPHKPFTNTGSFVLVID